MPSQVVHSRGSDGGTLLQALQNSISVQSTGARLPRSHCPFGSLPLTSPLAPSLSLPLWLPLFHYPFVSLPLTTPLSPSLSLPFCLPPSHYPFVSLVLTTPLAAYVPQAPHLSPPLSLKSGPPTHRQGLTTMMTTRRMKKIMMRYAMWYVMMRCVDEVREDDVCG